MIFIAEMKKVLKKIEIKAGLIIACVIPFLFAILKYTGSSSVTMSGGESKLTAMMYTAIIIGLEKMIFFPYILFIIYSSNLISNEIEKGQIFMVVYRVNNRNNIILSKIFTLICVLIFFFVLSIFSGITSYYLFLNNTDIASHLFVSNSSMDRWFEIGSILLVFLEYLFFIILTVFVSLYLKNIKTILATLMLFATCKILEIVPKIKVFIPTYIGSRLMSDIPDGEYSSIFIKSSLLLILYILILLPGVLIRFKKMDMLVK